MRPGRLGFQKTVLLAEVLVVALGLFLLIGNHAAFDPVALVTAVTDTAMDAGTAVWTWIAEQTSELTAGEKAQ